jgi:hypothetical protein
MVAKNATGEIDEDPEKPSGRARGGRACARARNQRLTAQRVSEIAKTARQRDGEKYMTGVPTSSVPTPTQPNILQQMMQAALRGAIPIPRLHANSLAVAQSASDVAIVLFNNAAPVATINIPYMVAKQLVTELQTSIDRYQKAAGQEVKNVMEVDRELQRIISEADDHAVRI